MASVTVEQLVSNAFTELGVLSPGQTLRAPEGAWGLSKLNRLLGQWNTKRLYVWVVNWQTFSMIAPLTSFATGVPNYYNIGLTADSPDFVVTGNRPPRIESANLILRSSTPYVNIPLPVINTDDYAALAVPTLTSTLPIKIYYEPRWPMGRIYPWPFPTVLTNGIQLFMWNQLVKVTSLADTLDFPEGYEDALTYSLAESMIPTYPNAAAADAIVELAKRARANIQSLNSPLPNIKTADGFKGTGGRPQPNYNYRSDTFTSGGR